MNEERENGSRASSCSLFLGDCLDVMADIEDGSIDMVMTDPPYGTTACKWDSIIPLEPMWGHLKRVIKPNGAIVMTASQPFTTTLIASNMKMFKYCWVWYKNVQTGIGYAKYRPMSCHEDVLVFSGSKTTYNKQLARHRTKNPSKNKHRTYEGQSEHLNLKFCGKVKGHRELVNPRTVLELDVVPKCQLTHPTQKPVALMEYLIKTYTNEGETVLDFTMGSGTTGVACKNLNRSFVGIEMDEKYFQIAEQRISKANDQ